jgi:hypothetical protein
MQPHPDMTAAQDEVFEQFLILAHTEELVQSPSMLALCLERIDSLIQNCHGTGPMISG